MYIAVAGVTKRSCVCCVDDREEYTFTIAFRKGPL